MTVSYMTKLKNFDKESIENIQYSRYIYKRVDGQDLALTVVYPSDAKPKGCAFFIHGGGFTSGSSARLLPHAKYAALNGAVGVSIDYRYIDEKEKTDVRDGVKDCADALCFVRRLLTDKYGKLNYISIGDSAGGYYAACLGCRAIIGRVFGEEPVDYVVDLNGIIDLTGKWSYAVLVKEADTFDKKCIAKCFSPLYNVDKGDSSVLIVHGDNDQTVALNDSVSYAEKLSDKAVDCELRVLNGAGHAFILFDYRHDNGYVEKILQSVTEFLKNKDLI